MYVNKYKDIHPKTTVENIQRILRKNRIKLEESWMPKNEIGTYSLTLHIKGTSVGSNGKGMTKDYARASAYAEFMERYQNNALLYAIDLLFPEYNERGEFYIFADEKRIPIDEFFACKNSFIKMFSRYGLNIEEQIRKGLLDDLTFDSNSKKYGNSLPCIPFFSVNNRSIEYMPLTIHYFYASNGMCAGNSPEEALCEGMFEIYERYVFKQIFVDKPTFPDIPYEFISRFPKIHAMYDELMKRTDLHVILKDCSCEGKYPVVGMILIEKNTGKYGLKLGAHYDYEVALERVFTEAFQGRHVKEFVRLSDFDFSGRNASRYDNYRNSLCMAIGDYPIEMFGDKPTYKFTEPDFLKPGDGNKEMLANILKRFTNDGYDVLIRNVSYLGFPDFHIIIPGFSENLNSDIFFDLTGNNDSSKYLKYRSIVVELLKNPAKINRDNCTYIIGLTSDLIGYVFENELRSIVPSTYDYPGKEFGLDMLYLIAMCYLLREEHVQALQAFGIFIAQIQAHGQVPAKYAAIRIYIEGLIAGRDHTSIIRYMRPLFDSDICDSIDDLFADRTQLIVKQYPRVDLTEDTGFMSEFTIFKDTVNKIRMAQKNNPINQMSLSNLFADFRGESKNKESL